MDLIEFFKAVILGIVEGITEWLPISSTGHMILVDEFIHLDVSEKFMQLFLVVIQLGAILSVVVLYWHKLWPFCKNKIPRGRMLVLNKKNIIQRKIQYFIEGYCNRDKWILWFKIFLSCIPTIIIGLPFNSFIEKHFNNYVVVSIMLILYGIIFIVVEDYNKKRRVKYTKIKDLPFSIAFIIGLFQVLAVIPGTSRSGATIIGGILIGVSRTVAAEFTFFLGIPVMFGASLLKLIKFGFSFSATEIFILLTGFIVAFIVSIFAIKFLMSYIKKHDFKAFGWYRIFLGIIVLLYFGVMNILG